MNFVVNKKIFILGIASICTSTLHAAAFDKTGQSVAAFYNRATILKQV